MNVTVVTATALEAKAARAALPRDVRVIEAGIALSRARNFEGAAISCGVCGGLRADLRAGDVIVPRTVRRPDGTLLDCDVELAEAFLNAAGALGAHAVDAPLITSAALVHGAERKRLAEQGYAAADMETGLIRAPRVACVRVVLDTTGREIDRAWADPRSVVFHPRAWRDLPFLAREGPRCASLAARVVAYALTSAARSSAVR